MNQFLDSKNRQEATILVAGIALHAMLSQADRNATDVVTQAFIIAREFLKQAEAKP